MPQSPRQASTLLPFRIAQAIYEAKNQTDTIAARLQRLVINCPDQPTSDELLSILEALQYDIKNQLTGVTTWFETRSKLQVPRVSSPWD